MGVDHCEAVLVVVLRKHKLGQVEVGTRKRQVVPQVGLAVELNGSLVRFHGFAVHPICAVRLREFVPGKHKLEQHLVFHRVVALVSAKLDFNVRGLQCVFEHLRLRHQILCCLLYHFVDF